MDQVETNDSAKVESNKTEFNKGMRKSYDANFKLMVIREAEGLTTSVAAKKFGVSECNVRRWRQQKNELKNAHSARKAFRGPKKGRVEEVDDLVAQYIDEMRRQGYPVTREVICDKAGEIAKNLNIPDRTFKASVGWCRRMMRRFGLSLRKRNTLAHRLPSDFEEKLLSFQQYLLDLRENHNIPLMLVCSADETRVYFDMPTNVGANKRGVKSEVVETIKTENVEEQEQ